LQFRCYGQRHNSGRLCNFMCDELFKKLKKGIGTSLGVSKLDPVGFTENEGAGLALNEAGEAGGCR
jgi:hypothetical protein